MADALVRHDELIADAVEAHGGSLDQVDGRGRRDRLGVRLGAGRGRGRARRQPRAGGRGRGRRASASPCAGASTPARPSGATRDYLGPTRQPRRARARRRPTAARSSCPRSPPSSSPAHLPEGCSLVDLGPHRLTGVGTPERIHALAGPGVRTPPPRPSARTAACSRSRPTTARFFFGREAVVARARRAARARPAARRRRRVGQRQVLGPARRRRRGRARRRGRRARHAVLLTPGAEPALDVADEPDRLVVVDQFEELFTLCDDADRAAARSSTRCCALRCAVAIGVRADLYGRLSGHARARARRRRQPGAARADDRRRARARRSPSRRGSPA